MDSVNTRQKRNEEEREMLKVLVEIYLQKFTKSRNTVPVKELERKFGLTKVESVMDIIKEFGYRVEFQPAEKRHFPFPSTMDRYIISAIKE